MAIDVGALLAWAGQGLKGMRQKYAPAYAMAGNFAAPAMQGIGQGAGAAVGWAGANLVAQPIKGIKGLVLNLVPENYMGFYVWVIIITYWMSWWAGFATTRVWASHSILGILGFIIFLLTDGLSWQTFRKYGVTFSILIIVDYLLLTGKVYWPLLMIAAVLLAFREGSPVEDFKRVFLVLAIATIGNRMYAQLLGFVAPQMAKLSLPIGLDYVPYIGAVLLNRTITFPYLWFAIFGLNKQTRVARSLAWFVMLLVLFAFWPQLSPEINKVRSQYAGGVTAEQQAVVPSLFQKAAVGTRSLGASLGTLISIKTASAYEKAQETFGFGEPKEQPKLGLQLSQNSKTVKVFPDYKDPEPSFIMSIPNPFPADAKKQYIEVTDIKCNENSGKKLTFVKAVTDEQFIFDPSQKNAPVEVDYSGSGGSGVSCIFSGWQKGENYNVGAEVTYAVENNAYLSTTFMRADTLKATRRDFNNPKNRALLAEIPPADARYDNVPVTITWDPPILTSAPAPIDINRESNNLAITVYVAKNQAWEGGGAKNGEIKSVDKFSLTVPNGVTLAGDTCDFDLPGKVNKDGSTEYQVKENRIRKDGKPRFIGDAIRFDCGMIVTSAALGGEQGKEKASVEFDAHGEFSFTAKIEGIAFTFGEGDKSRASQASPPSGQSGSTAPAPSGSSGIATPAPTTPPAQPSSSQQCSSSAGPTLPATDPNVGSYKTICQTNSNGGIWKETASGVCCDCKEANKVWSKGTSSCMTATTG